MSHEAITGDVPWSDQSQRAVMFAMMFNKSCLDRPETHIPTYYEHGDMLWLLLKSYWTDEPGKRSNAEQVAEVVSLA